MYNRACVVNVHLHPVQTTNTPPHQDRQSHQGRQSHQDRESHQGRVPAQGTCCGILLDTEHGLVLAHASCLGPLLEQGDLDLTSPTLTLNRVQRLSCEVLLQRDRRCVEVEQGIDNVPEVTVNALSAETASIDSHLIGDKGTSIEQINTRTKTETFSTFPAHIVHCFQCPSLKDCLNTLMPTPEWQLLDRTDAKKESDNSYSNNNNNNNNNNSGHSETVMSEENMMTLLSSFVVLKLDKWWPYSSPLKVRSTCQCKQGDRVEICSTPFAGLRPHAFINSHSRGVVSNLAGPNNCLMLSDARCILGGEGAPLYTFQPSVGSWGRIEERYMTAIILASLTWKNEEWVGFCVASDLATVLQSASPYFQRLCPRGHHGSLSSDSSCSPVQSGLSSVEVVLLRVGTSWGSGVVVDGETGTILTCSHVVRDAQPHTVEAQRGGVEGRRPVKVLYQQRPLTHQFDLALVQLVGQTQSICTSSAPVCMAAPVEGTEVYVVGHAVFGAEHNLAPSVTSGVISKVISINKIPVMIQTTCAVHPGTSGGALVDTRGRLLGIVVCNARDNSCGASFPHVNMSIPVCTVWSTISHFLKTRDVGHLKQLCVKNAVLDTIWSLGPTQDIEERHLDSKL